MNPRFLPKSGPIINVFKDQIGYFGNYVKRKRVLCIGFSIDDLKEFVEPYEPSEIICLTLWEDHKDAKIFGYKIVIGDISKPTEFQDKYFDAIITLSLFEHILDLEGALREINRILKIGGYVYAHCGPVWSCPTGHHIISNEHDKLLNFLSGEMPSYIHLLCSREQIKSYYFENGYTENDFATVIHWFYDTPLINRYMYEDILAFYKKYFYIVATNNMYYTVEPKTVHLLEERYPNYHDFQTYGGGTLLVKML